MYYIPAEYDNAFNFIFDHSASDIDVDALLAKHPHALKNSSNTLFDCLSEDAQQK